MAERKTGLGGGGFQPGESKIGSLGGGWLWLLGYNHRSRPQKPIAELITSAQLLQDLTLRHLRRFPLGDRFVNVWVKRFAGGIDLFQTRLDQRVAELGKDHVHP